MKNNLRFMDKSVQKDPGLLVTEGETTSEDYSASSGWRRRRAGRSLGGKHECVCGGGGGWKRLENKGRSTLGKVSDAHFLIYMVTRT